MAQQEIPASPSYRYTYYNHLRGIDLTCDVTQVPYNRAADILNVTPDTATSNPRKRVGWRKLYAFGETETFLGSRHLKDWGIDIIVTNRAVYWHSAAEKKWTEDTVHRLIENQNNVDSGVCFVGFDGDRDYRLNVYQKRYILYKNGSEITYEEITDGYIPMTIISRNPDGTDGYAYEAVNAFTPRRMICFLSTTTAKDFYFYPEADRENHVVVEVTEVEVRNSSTGEWEAIAFTTKVTGEYVTAYSAADKSIASTYQRVEGFTLSAAHAPVVAGQDNVRAKIVEFSPDTDDRGICYGYYSPIVEGIMTNNVCARYGTASMDREFYVAGNGKIYYTDPDNYDYLPDNNYLQIEVDAPIVGFHRKNTFLVAITQDSAEFTIFMISGRTGSITHSVYNEQGVRESSSEEFTYFIAQTAIAGTGAVSAKAFGTLVDDTLFLGRHGIYGITSNNLTSETVIANRSELINPKLEEESGLENATCAIWNGMYLLAVNDHMYILDSHVTHKNIGISWGYECYYWDNVPATNMLSYEGDLFFGDHTGNWCRLNTDIHNSTAFEDDGQLDEHGNVEGGQPIHALYALRLDSDNYPQYLKTLNKRGTSIELMQLPYSGVRLSYSKDGDEPIFVNELTLKNEFVWNLVDFENFHFDGASHVRTFYPRKKIKKYKYLQFIFESDTLDQNFGLCGVTKTYFIGNFAKR